MRFSIICPIYNKEKYIKETIESVISQTYDNWELLLVDDGSTDNSVSIVEGYKCDKIKLLYRSDFTQRKGGSVARNIGIKHAKGTFIMFLDADDVLSKNSLEQRSYYIYKYPEYNFYVFDIIHFLNNIDNVHENRFVYNFKRINYSLSSKSRLFFLRKFLKYDTQWSICNVIWKKETLLNLNGFSENFQRLQDVELHTRALLNFDIKFKFLKYKVKPDVYVRSDKDRSSSISTIETFMRVSTSITEYIKQNYFIINEINKQHLIKYLNAYILLFEQFYTGYYHKMNKNELELLSSTRNEFYEKISFLIDDRIVRVIGIYKSLSKFEILNKFRIPAIYVYLYKMFLI